jgi:hypothetical protein
LKQPKDYKKAVESSRTDESIKPDMTLTQGYQEEKLNEVIHANGIVVRHDAANNTGSFFETLKIQALHLTHECGYQLRGGKGGGEWETMRGPHGPKTML